jgi:hypothetical protein
VIPLRNRRKYLEGEKKIWRENYDTRRKSQKAQSEESLRAGWHGTAGM